VPQPYEPRGGPGAAAGLGSEESPAASDHSGWGAEARADAAMFAAWERFERRVAATMARARKSVVALEYTAAEAPAGTRRVATGVVINNRGEILSIRIDPPPARPAPGTGRNLAPIVACDSLGRRHVAQWVAADPETGLTLLRVSPRAVQPIRTAADGPQLGNQVFVVGNPSGMGQSVSRGYVAGLDRALELGTSQLGGLIQVQAPLYPGDSGAAVVDLRGDWLGLIRGGLAIPGWGRASDPGPGHGPPGSTLAPGQSPPADAMDPDDDPLTAAGRLGQDTDFGFAIPTRDALWIADQLRAHGRVDRAYLGVRLERMIAAASPLAPSEPAAPPGDGAVVREVLGGTPAARAGLRPGDRIVAVDGQPIRSPHDLIDRLDRIPAGTTILLGVVRGAERRRPRIALSLQTASRPDPPLASSGAPPPASEPGSGSLRASVPVTPTASRSRPALPPRPDPAAPPTRPSAPQPSPAYAPPSSHPDPTPPDRAGVVNASPAPPLNELRFTSPHTLVERLEQLERRLEKLEALSTSTPTSSAGITPNRRVASDRKP
jgi:S1-C subfamily serine protease